ncbi:hypothetical protein [Bacillus sp. m3-13]|nr:hypothetical protein [Bacillus sp. m3-13]
MDVKEKVKELVRQAVEAYMSEQEKQSGKTDHHRSFKLFLQ